MMEQNNNSTLTEEYLEKLRAEKEAKRRTIKVSQTPPMGGAMYGQPGQPGQPGGLRGRRKIKKKSPIPYFILTGAFFLCPFFMATAGAGAGFFIKFAIMLFIIFKISKKIWPDSEEYLDTSEPIVKETKKTNQKKSKKVVEVVKEEPVKKEEPKKEEKKFTTGDPEIDKMIEDKEKAVIEMRRLNDAILDPTLSMQIDHLEEVTTKILNYVVEHPNKKSQVSRFFNYYLPTTLKLLNSYDRMDDAGISGMNIDGTKGKVEEMMTTAMTAFDKQLDALFADEALDVATDIKVMENLLRSEGLTEDEEVLKI